MRVQVVFSVSVPLRGKEGGGHSLPVRLKPVELGVSVPLRGKEGGGPAEPIEESSEEITQFPSPCGVRRVGDQTHGMTFSSRLFERVSVPLRGKEGGGHI